MRKVDPSKAVLKAWQALTPPQKKLPIFIGVSGGGDSSALAKVALSLRDRLPEIRWIHVNYGLRRPASDREESHLRRWAHQERIRLHVLRLNPQSKPKNLQAWARERRLRFFARTIEKVVKGKGLVWLAHHEQDQAETVLLRLLRGAGLNGLGGIQSIESIRVPGHKRPLLVLRPFLKVPKEAIQRFLKARQLLYFEDRSNHSAVYQRNRIRHQILPLILKENPRAVQALCELAERAASASEALDHWAENELMRWFKKTKNIDELPIKFFDKKPPGLWPFLFKKYFQSKGWESETLSRQIPNLMQALHSRSAAPIFWLKRGKRLQAGPEGLAVLSPSRRKSF